MRDSQEKQPDPDWQLAGTRGGRRGNLPGLCNIEPSIPVGTVQEPKIDILLSNRGTMSPKKAILRTLSQEYRQTGPGTLTRPSSIPGFSEKPEEFQKAVNGLLQTRLVEGTTDPGGRLAITLNPHRLTDIQRELRPLWKRPVLWALILVVAAVVGLGMSP